MGLTPSQCRGARGLLQITQADLAQKSGVSLGTVIAFESEKRNPIPANIEMLRRTLESEGIVFIDANGDGPGVRLKKKRG